MQKSRTVYRATAIGVLMILCGCFSIARYEANVRPDTVKPSAAVTGKYRLERILLGGSYFAEGGGISEADYVELQWMFEVLKQCGDEKGKAVLKSFLTSAIQSGVGARIKEWDEPQAFAEFARDFAKEMPMWRREIAKRVQAYCEADEAADAALKATSITNMVALYGTVKGLSNMLVHFKEGSANATGENIRRLGYNNGKEMFEGKFKEDYLEKTFAGSDGQSNKMYFDAIKDALLKNYPSVFTVSQDATPVTVLVSFENKFEDQHSYGALFCALGWPLSQEVEVTYRVRVVQNAAGRSDAELWSEYADSQLEYPPSVQNGGAVRLRDMWTSVLLPFSLIGIPGDSDWPKERKAFTMGSTMISKEREYLARYFMASFAKYPNDMFLKDAEKLSHEYMERFIFDPVSDGDIIAALIMRSLNKMSDVK